jgi:hypothetical protein
MINVVECRTLFTSYYILELHTPGGEVFYVLEDLRQFPGVIIASRHQKDAERFTYREAADKKARRLNCDLHLSSIYADFEPIERPPLRPV